MPLLDQVLRQRRIPKDEGVTVVDVQIIEISIQKRGDESGKDEEEDQPPLKTGHEPEVLLTSFVLSHFFPPEVGKPRSMTAFFRNELECIGCCAAGPNHLAAQREGGREDDREADAGRSQ